MTWNKAFKWRHRSRTRGNSTEPAFMHHLVKLKNGMTKAEKPIIKRAFNNPHQLLLHVSSCLNTTRQGWLSLLKKQGKLLRKREGRQMRLPTTTISGPSNKDIRTMIKSLLSRNRLWSPQDPWHSQTTDLQRQILDNEEVARAEINSEEESQLRIDNNNRTCLIRQQEQKTPHRQQCEAASIRSKRRLPRHNTPTNTS